MDFWASKIDLKFQKHLVASSHENSVEQFADFIMATDIGLFILLFVKIISHQAFTSIILVFYWKVYRKNDWSKIFKPVLLSFHGSLSSITKRGMWIQGWVVQKLSGSEIV